MSQKKKERRQKKKKKRDNKERERWREKEASLFGKRTEKSPPFFFAKIYENPKRDTQNTHHTYDASSS